MSLQHAEQLDFIAALERKPAPPPQPAALPDLTGRARELLRAIGCPDLAARVQVRWHPRLRSTAGQALYAECLVRMNPRLIGFGPEEVEKTLRHELAHLAARARAGRRRIQPHGPEWRDACAELGLAGEKSCHQLPLPRSRQRVRHRYRCPHCLREYPRVRPFRRAVACLACCRAHARGAYDARYKLIKL